MLANTHAQIDKDGDGQISYIEFKDLVRGLENERGGLRPKGYEPHLDVAVHTRPRLAGNTSSNDPLGTWSKKAKEGGKSSSSSSST